MRDIDASLRDRATAAEPVVSALRDGIPSAVRDLTESGDFYEATPEAWRRYRAAVAADDWDEVMRLETGQYADFCYAP